MRYAYSCCNNCKYVRNKCFLQLFYCLVNKGLKNVELEFFPANCTSLIQPLDQGIIHSVKCSYRKRLIEKMLFNLQLKRETKIDVFMAVEMLANSWQVTKREGIGDRLSVREA